MILSTYEDYNPSFYSVISSHNSYNIFSNTLLIDKTIVYISYDFQDWGYINNTISLNTTSLINYYQKEFAKLKVHTNPMIKITTNMPSFFKSITSIKSKSTLEYTFRRDLTSFSPPPNITLDWSVLRNDLVSKD